MYINGLYCFDIGKIYHTFNMKHLLFSKIKSALCFKYLIFINKFQQ